MIIEHQFIKLFINDACLATLRPQRSQLTAKSLTIRWKQKQLTVNRAAPIRRVRRVPHNIIEGE